MIDRQDYYQVEMAVKGRDNVIFYRDEQFRKVNGYDR